MSFLPEWNQTGHVGFTGRCRSNGTAVSLVNHKNGKFLMIFNREIAKRKKKTRAYVVVSRRLPYHIYSMLKNGKPYRKRSPVVKGREGEHFHCRLKRSV